MSIRKTTLILNGPQYDALLAGARLLAGALGEGAVNPDDGDVGDILTNSGEHPGLTASEVYDLGDAMQAGDLDANELPLLRAIAEAARKVDIGAPSKARLAAFEALGEALVSYHGAPLAFQGRFNPGGDPYPIHTQRLEVERAERGRYVNPVILAKARAAVAKEDARRAALPVIPGAEKPLSEVERLGLTTTPPTWESGDLRAWIDRFGGIVIHHAGDGSEAYLQPGDEANGLAATLDQIDSHANFGPAAKAAKYDALAEYLPPGSLD